MSENIKSFVNWFGKLVKIWLPVWLWISGLYAITQFVTWYFFGLTVWDDVWIRDGFIHVMFGGLLFNLCRGFWPWAAAYTVLITVLQISNALKYSVLGSPIMPDDFIGFVNMFMLFDDWRLWAMWAAGINSGPVVGLRHRLAKAPDLGGCWRDYCCRVRFRSFCGAAQSLHGCKLWRPDMGSTR